jgi:hypothetical protein
VLLHPLPVCSLSPCAAPTETLGTRWNSGDSASSFSSTGEFESASAFIAASHVFYGSPTSFSVPSVGMTGKCRSVPVFPGIYALLLASTQALMILKVMSNGLQFNIAHVVNLVAACFLRGQHAAIQPTTTDELCPRAKSEEGVAVPNFLPCRVQHRSPAPFAEPGG